VLDDSGNIHDACGLAAVAALMGARMYPTGIINNQTLIFEDRRIPLNQIPVLSTIASLGGEMLVDPCMEEEKNADWIITFSLSSRREIHSAQLIKGHLSKDELVAAARVALDKYDFLRSVLEVGKESNSIIGIL
jgi:exosome complex component RRP42